MFERKTFGFYIRRARLERHLTLQAVATAIDSHKGYVSGDVASVEDAVLKLKAAERKVQG